MPQTVYFKRYRMEADLTQLGPIPELPAGYVWLPWNDVWLDTHAEVKFRSFHAEIDSIVFPNLGHRDGCAELMNAIRQKPTFCAAATWLVASLDGYCGTVQGLLDSSGPGAIQNLGVVPEHRGLGLGSALLLKALHGFRQCGARRAFLEVTARNESAVRMYRRLGFWFQKTVYRPVEVPAEDVFPTV